ncbi:MAG: hemolysin III family protein [Clostridiales bacterium]|nr:hemolysin III family protein [Clostridiales bacterium]
MPKLFLKARDPLSCYTHFIGFVLAIIGTLAILVKIALNGFYSSAAMGLLFCISLMGLYGASSLYHSSNTPTETIKRLRKLDHSMIYVLIAGTYTPLLFNILPEPKNMVLVAVIWGLALAGIVMKLCWIEAPRWLGTTLYILMGWFIAIDFSALSVLETEAIILLIAGGFFYTTGGIMYAIKKPNISKMFGFHEVFHIFIMAGSLCHYFMVLCYLV